MAFFSFLGVFFNKVVTEFRKVVNKLKPFAQKQIPVAIEVINAFKFAVETGAAKFVVGLTPTNLDNFLLQKGELYLPILLDRLKLYQVANNKALTNDEKVRAAMDFMRGLDPKDRAGKYFELTAHLSIYLADGKFTWQEIAATLQKFYDLRVNRKAV